MKKESEEVSKHRFAQEESFKRAADDLRSVMSTEAGRRHIWAQLGKCGLYHSSFTGNSTTFFNEGKRAVGLELQSRVLDACPDLYLLAQQEQLKNEEIPDGK